MTLSDNIVVMNGGIIEQTGTPYEVYEHPRNRFVASFLGKANFFGGKVAAAGGDHAALETENGSLTIPCLGAKEGETVTYAVRPEKIIMQRTGEGLRGTITSVVYSGNVTAFHVRCGAMEVLTEERSAGGETFRRGDEVVLTWAPGSAVRLED